MLTTCHNHLGMTARPVRELKTLSFTSFTTAYGVVSCAIADQAFKMPYVKLWTVSSLPSSSVGQLTGMTITPRFIISTIINWHVSALCNNRQTSLLHANQRI